MKKTFLLAAVVIFGAICVQAGDKTQTGTIPGLSVTRKLCSELPFHRGRISPSMKFLLSATEKIVETGGARRAIILLIGVLGTILFISL